MSPKRAWKIIEPVFRRKLTALCALAGVKAEIDDATDSEYGLACNIGHLRIEATLAEENIRMGKGTGLQASYSGTTEDGSPVALYAPGNFTPKAFTTNYDELYRRADDFEPYEFWSIIAKEA